MAVRLLAKFCPSDNSAYFPSKDASFSLSCRHQGRVKTMQSLQHQHARTVATFCSVMSKLFFSLWKFSLSCWACKAIWEDCFFSVASLSWDNNNRTRTMLTHDSPQCIETNAAMFADELQCQKQNSRQLIYRYLYLSACCSWLSRYQGSQKICKNQFGNCPTLHMDISAGLYDRYLCTVPCVWQQGADTQRSPSAPPDSDSPFLLIDWFLLPASETPNSPNL